MSNLVGIDLGTTYSAISRLDETGRPEIIDNSEGENITPSIVLFESKLFLFSLVRFVFDI